MLKVTVAEVQRDIIKQMGIDLSASMNYGTAVVKFNNSQSVHGQLADRWSPATPRRRRSLRSTASRR